MTGIYQTSTGPASLQSLLDKFSSLLNAGFIGFTDLPVHLELLEGGTPEFHKASPAPFALCRAGEAQLHRRETRGISQVIRQSECATPLVLVKKRNSQLHFCGDYRCTVNADSQNSAYQLPTTEEVLSRLQGVKIFSTLDLAQAYM